MTRIAASVLAAALFAAPAFAQDPPATTVETLEDGTQVQRPGVQRIDFNEVDVNATADRPSVDLIGARTSAVFAPMIKVRHDFNAEMEASVRSVK